MERERPEVGISPLRVPLERVEGPSTMREEEVVDLTEGARERDSVDDELDVVEDSVDVVDSAKDVVEAAKEMGPGCSLRRG